MNPRPMFRFSCIAMLCLMTLGIVCVGQAAGQVQTHNGLVSYTVQKQQTQLDFVNAKPMPLPANPFVPQDHGLNYHPFTTVRADLGGATNKMVPYKATGKLYFLIGSNTYMCSASLIKNGVIVTAAHCVANYGEQQFYTGWQFIPGYRNGVAPFGIQTAYQAWILGSYYDGTDGCYVEGIICPDDVAVIILNYMPGTTKYVGKRTGFYAYNYDGYGFTPGLMSQITQLGYPAGLDYAAYMERTDSYGVTNTTYSNNTVIGSNMDGGSSGGPWLINFGKAPVLTGETNGSAPALNTVVGVTSWGYVDKSYKEQGASPFTSGNIVPLMSAACTSVPAACK